MIESIAYRDFLEECQPGDKVVAMVSGGLDSVAAVYKLLTETECEIIMGHVSLQNREKRWEAENIAIGNLYQYLSKNIRPFGFNESTFRFNHKNFMGWDVDVTNGFIASQILVGEKNARYVASGLNKSDLERSRVVDRAGRTVNIIDGATEGLVEFKPKFVRPVRDMYKSDMIDQLPEELVQLTWSCRTPVRNESSWTRCGKCYTCQEMKREGPWNSLPHEIKF